MIKAGLKVAKGGADLAGPHGKVVSTGISVVGTAIEYGGKVYFANVDFNRASSAKQTLLRAQAGSTVDRLLVFENCAVYAKMYIAILAKEKNKLAEEFIIKRGYTESDIAKEEVSATILREFLMKDAKQVDERETTDSRLVATGEGLAGITLKEGKGYLEKAKNFKEKYFPPGLEGVSPSAYDPKWAHIEAEVVINPATFQAVWKRAVAEAGLFDDGTVAPPELATAKKILEDFGVRDDLTLTGLKSGFTLAETNLRSPLRHKDRLTEAIKSFQAARTTLSDVQPMHTPDGEKQQVGEHLGMGKYILALVKMLSAMESMVSARLQGFKDETFGDMAESVWLCDSNGKPLKPDKLMNTNWKHTKCELTVKNWTDNRTEALRLAWREEEIGTDPGVSAAIGKVVQASASKDLGKKKSDPAWRKSRIAWRTALETLISELDKYWSTCEHEGLRACITEMKLLAAEQLRRLDSELYPSLQDLPLDEVNGENVPVSQKFTSEAWKKAYNSSLGNFDDDIDDAKKLHEGLKAWEKAAPGLNGKSGQDLRKARIAVITALKDIGLNAAATGRVVGTQALVKYLHFIATHAQKLLGEQLNAHRSTSFNYQQVQNFQKDSWLAAYADAVRVGAVPEAKSQSAKLGSAIETAQIDFNTVRDKFSLAGSKCNKEVRAAAEKLLKSLVEVRQAVGKLKEVDGYMDHPQMNACLDIIQNCADRVGEANFVTQVLQGAGAEFGKFRFEWETSHWDLSVKRAAIEAGLLAEDARTGMAAAISTIIEKNRAVLDLLGPRGGQSGTGSIDDRAKELKLLKEYKDAVEKLIKIATAQKSQVSNKNYQAYMDDCIDNCHDYLKIFGGRDDALSYKAPSKLVYTNEAWQDQKKLAVAAGALPDVRTNFGKFITESSQAYTAFMDAKSSGTATEDDLRVKRVTARGSLGVMTKQITNLKSTYKDEQLGRYMDLWSNEVKDRWKNLAN
jgi:hypothetical protein